MRAKGRWLSLVALGLVTALAGCAAQASPRALPTASGFDYQLGGSYSPPSGVSIVTRDSTAKPSPGMYNICYINGFQTQSEDKKFWLQKHPTLVLRTSGGTPVFDPGWPDEMILDVSTPAKRDAIAQVMDGTIDRCRSKGFAAVEFDNLDSYSRSRHAFGLAADQALAELLVRHAHADGLAAGQKNTPELDSRGRTQVHFDFAVAEECYRYDECAAYTKAYGARVLDIEYTDDLRGTFAHDCASRSRPAMMILRDRDLVPRGSKGYVYRRC
jgi:Glycoside-hydrolase family GH114